MAHTMIDPAPYAEIVGDAGVSLASSWRSSAEEAWHAPSLVVAPRSTEEVRQVIMRSLRDGLPIIPAGGGTGYSGGVTSRDGGIVLDTRRMTRLISVDERLRLARVEAGITVAEFNRQLERLGLWWPHSPGSREMATVGGTISVRGVGSYFTRYGAAPETVYGLSMVLGDGNVLSLDPRPRERSAGYNLLALLLSSEGTLGVITEVVVKVWPLPAHREVQLIAFPSLEQAEDYVRALWDAGVSPEVLLVESRDRLMNDFEWRAVTPAELEHDLGDAQWIVVAGYAGAEAVAKWLAAHGTEMARGMGGRPFANPAVVRAYWQRKTEALTRERTSIPSYHVSDPAMPGLELTGLDRAYSSTTSMFHLRRKGVRFYVAWPTGETVCSAQVFYDSHNPQATKRVREWNGAMAHEVQSRGGTSSSILGIGVRLAGLLDAERSAAELDVMRKLKTVLDPANLMNRGKMLREP